MNITSGTNFNFIKSNKFKTTVICILFRRYLNKSEVTKNALIANLLTKGSEHFETIKKINAKTEKMYGSVFDVQVVKKSEEQILQFYLEILSEKVDSGLLEEGFEFLNEVIYNTKIVDCGFPIKNFEIEKENIKNIIESRIDDKSEYAKLRLLEEMCKDEAFGIYADGYLEDLESIDNKNLYTHYKTILDTSPIEIIVIGDEDEKNILQIVKKIFKNRENIMKINEPKTIYDKIKPKEIYEKKPLSQGKICMGFRCNTKNKGRELYSLIVLNEIFGGSANSKLFLNLREKESLCYFVSSFVYRFKSILFVQSGVDEDNFSKAQKLIIAEMENIKSGKFSDENLEESKKSIVKKFKVMEDSQSATIDYYSSQYLINDTDTIEDAICLLEKITREDVVNISKNIYLDTSYFLGNDTENQLNN